jgi:hypothetical protein
MAHSWRQGNAATGDWENKKSLSLSRGGHLEAMKKQGLQGNSIFKNFRIEHVTATSNFEQKSPTDLIIFDV